MIVMSLDLEMNQPSGKIIQIGITIGDLTKRSIIETKSFMVNPEEEITEYINKLTGITQNQVKDAPVLVDAYKQMNEWLDTYKPHKQSIVWGQGDVRTLKKQVNDIDLTIEHRHFGFREMDVKTLVQAHQISIGKSSQGGLAKSLTKYGMKFRGACHNAEADSLNTLLLYYRLLDRLAQS